MKLLVCIKRQSKISEHVFTRKKTNANSMFMLVFILAVFKGFYSPFSEGERKKIHKDIFQMEGKVKSKEKFSRKLVSRDSCQSYTDTTGIDLCEFN